MSSRLRSGVTCPRSSWWSPRAPASGTLAGQDSPAAKGDAIYAEPWVVHGIKNTGATPLTFVVMKWNTKGVANAGTCGMWVFLDLHSQLDYNELSCSHAISR